MELRQGWKAERECTASRRSSRHDVFPLSISMTQLDASSTALSTSTPLEAPDTRQQQQQRPTTAAAIAELPSPSTLPPVSATYSPIVLPPLYLDPETYLLDERFHRSLRWRPSWFAEDDEDDDGAAMERHRVTYAVCGSLDDEAPVLVWLNGLGSFCCGAVDHDPAWRRELKSPPPPLSCNILQAVIV